MVIGLTALPFFDAARAIVRSVQPLFRSRERCGVGLPWPPQKTHAAAGPDRARSAFTRAARRRGSTGLRM